MSDMTANERAKDVFFIGLYMDAELLGSLGVEPREPRVARLDGHDLDLRGAVKALPQPDQSVWGVVYRLTDAELETLYSGPKTKLYQPGTVEVTTEDGQTLTLVCYNQPEDPSAPFNVDYCDKLIPAMKRAGLPASYIELIRTRRPASMTAATAE